MEKKKQKQGKSTNEKKTEISASSHDTESSQEVADTYCQCLKNNNQASLLT